MTLDKDYVRIRIAALLEEHMDINPTSALEDTAFTELHKDFDSLALLELQLLLEKEFSMEFDGFDRTAKIPTNLTEMADALIREYEQYQLRQAKKNPTQNNQVRESMTD
jgi:acyl carrier protein